VDITNPEARKWYKSKLVALMDLGVDCFKASLRWQPLLFVAETNLLQTDFAERIPHLNVKFHEETYNNYAVHNMYTILYNQLVHETLEERYGKGEAVLFARSSFAGGQR
jgi:alpha-glucosidase (family GH31 glycosyl hydrolase)